MKLSELIHDSTRILRAEHYSYRTEQCYLGWARRFFEFSRPRRELPLQERVNQYLGEMAPKVAVATTMIYTHCVAGFAAGVRSPLDTLGGKVVPFVAPAPLQIAAHSATA